MSFCNLILLMKTRARVYENTSACFCQVQLTKTNHTDPEKYDDCDSLFP